MEKRDTTPSKHATRALSGLMALAVAALLVSVTSYGLLTSPPLYEGVLHNPSWNVTFPDDLASELGAAVGGVLGGSDAVQASVSAMFSELISVSWAVEQGESLIHALLAYVRGDTDLIAGGIDIAPFKEDVAQALSGLLPDAVLDALIPLLPDTIPLSLLVGGESLSAMRNTVALLSALRIAAAAGLGLSLVALAYLRREGAQVVPLVGAACLWAGPLVALCTAYVALDVRHSFASTGISFLRSYGESLSRAYVSSMVLPLALGVGFSLAGAYVLYTYRIPS